MAGCHAKISFTLLLYIILESFLDTASTLHYILYQSSLYNLPLVMPSLMAIFINGISILTPGFTTNSHIYLSPLLFEVAQSGSILLPEHNRWNAWFDRWQLRQSEDPQTIWMQTGIYVHSRAFSSWQPIYNVAWAFASRWHCWANAFSFPPA